jgi:hypothetical protein
MYRIWFPEKHIQAGLDYIDPMTSSTARFIVKNAFSSVFMFARYSEPSRPPCVQSVQQYFEFPILYFPFFQLKSITATMSLDGPDWLKSDTAPKDDEPATSGGITSVPPPPPPPAAPVASSSTTADGEDDPDLPGVILTMRLANMGVAIALIAVSVRFAEVAFSKYE